MMVKRIVKYNFRLFRYIIKKMGKGMSLVAYHSLYLKKINIFPFETIRCLLLVYHSFIQLYIFKPTVIFNVELYHGSLGNPIDNILCFLSILLLVYLYKVFFFQKTWQKRMFYFGSHVDDPVSKSYH